MTSNDTKFMKEIGIQPCDLDKPFQPSLPLLPPESLFLSVTEKDISWLLKVGVIWGPDPTSDFVPPKNLREYLDRYPGGIRNAVEVIAKELKIRQSHDELDDLAQQIIVMFLEFAESEEDLVQTYSISPPPPTWGKQVSPFLYVLQSLYSGGNADPVGKMASPPQMTSVGGIKADGNRTMTRIRLT